MNPAVVAITMAPNPMYPCKNPNIIDDIAKNATSMKFMSLFPERIILKSLFIKTIGITIKNNLKKISSYIGAISNNTATYEASIVGCLIGVNNSTISAMKNIIGMNSGIEIIALSILPMWALKLYDNDRIIISR